MTRGVFLICLFFFCASMGCQAPETLPVVSANTNLVCDEESGLALFNTRIAPLLNTERPSSCQRCHLPGTDVAKFIRGETSCQKMACLIDQKLVDLEQPNKSKMLKWIERGHTGDAAPVDDPLVKREYEAFLQWIEFSSSCHQFACPPIDDPCGLRPPTPDMPDMPDMGDMEDCGLAGCSYPDLTPENYGCDPESLVDAFHQHPNEWKGRCDHCHSPKAGLAKVGRPPMFMSVLNNRIGARETVAMILAKEDTYLNLEEPEQSLLLLKPLEPMQGGVLHGGGTKIRTTEDEMYVDLLNWIKHVSYCRAQDP